MSEKLNKELATIEKQFGDRINTMSNRLGKTQKTAINLTWDLSNLLADIKKANASTNALGKIREQSFPSISKYDLSSYIFIGQNIDNVKRYYNHFELKLTSAKRIADRYKKAIKEAMQKVEAIKEKRKAIKEHLDNIKNADTDKAAEQALTQYQKRLESGNADIAPTTEQDKLESQVKHTLNTLYQAIDFLTENIDQLNETQFNSISKSFESVNQAYMKRANKKAA